MSKCIMVDRAALGAPLSRGGFDLETQTQAAAMLPPSSRAHRHKLFRNNNNPPPKKNQQKKRKKIPLAHPSRALLHPGPLVGQRVCALGPILLCSAAGSGWKVGLQSQGRSRRRRCSGEHTGTEEPS